MNSNWDNLVARRDLLQELVVSELKTSQAGTVLGWTWWLLDPLLMMLIYWGVFTILLGRGIEKLTAFRPSHRGLLLNELVDVAGTTLEGVRSRAEGTTLESWVAPVIERAD